MKKTFLIPVILLSLVIASCTHKGNPHGLPPGQAKKVTGSKSAKPYAPGQQKKKN